MKNDNYLVKQLNIEAHYLDIFGSGGGGGGGVIGLNDGRIGL